jgi:hypothetical protein
MAAQKIPPKLRPLRQIASGGLLVDLTELRLTVRSRRTKMLVIRLLNSVNSANCLSRM